MEIVLVLSMILLAHSFFYNAPDDPGLLRLQNGDIQVAQVLASAASDLFLANRHCYVIVTLSLAWSACVVGAAANIFGAAGNFFNA